MMNMLTSQNSDLAAELKALSEQRGLLDSLQCVVEWIINGGDNMEELFIKIRDKLSQNLMITTDEQINLLAAWCCADSLCQSPSLGAWKVVKKLQYTPWYLENYLCLCIEFIIDQDLIKRESILFLAKEVIQQTDKLFVQQASEENQKTQAIQEKRFWDSQKEQLEEIWHGIGRHGSNHYWQEPYLFELLVAYDIGTASSILFHLKNPYLCQQFVARAAETPKNTLEIFLQEAPVAFTECCQWNGNFIAPLLLAKLRQQLQGLRIDSNITLDEEDHKAHNIESMIDQVINIISKRDDSAPLFKRWSTWLMYRVLIEGGEKTEDPKSSAFVDSKLLSAIGNSFDSQAIPLPTKVPNGVMPWEHWCYWATLSFWSQNGVSIEIPYQEFLEEWDLTVDDWNDDKGKQLRNHSHSLISTYGQTRFPNDLAYLLSNPLAESAGGIEAWLTAWDSSYYLREIAEFGTGDKAYEERSKSGELLFFLWQVGFALFDTKARHCESADSELARALANLFQRLNSALQEMLIIVDTLTREKLEKMPELLAIRRLIWDSSISKDQREYCVFIESDQPRFDEYLKTVKSDVTKTAYLLSSALLNTTNSNLLIPYVRRAEIDIEAVIHQTQRLNAISSKHYPLDPRLLQELASLNNSF